MMNEKILSKLTTVNVWVFDLDDTLYPRESRFLGHFSIDPEKTAMFEDNLANLSTCKELGMTTILVGHKEDKEIPTFVDIEAPELESFLHNLVGRLNGAG